MSEIDRKLMHSDEVYSNFDHQLNKPVVEYLMTHPDVCAPHHAYYFMGYVWFEDDKWHEEVWSYKTPVQVFHANTVEEVIELACENWGSE